MGVDSLASILKTKCSEVRLAGSVVVASLAKEATPHFFAPPAADSWPHFTSGSLAEIRYGTH